MNIRIRISVQPQEIQLRVVRRLMTIGHAIESILSQIKTRSVGIFVCIKQNIRSIVFVVTCKLADDGGLQQMQMGHTLEHIDTAEALKYSLLRKSQG